MNAKQAKDISMHSASEKRKEIDKMIIEAAKKGEISIVLNGMSDAVITSLNDDGFKLIYLDGVGSFSNYMVSWL